MRTFTRLFLVTSLLLVSPTLLFAQTAAEVSGHWTGAIHVPPFNGAGSREIAIDVDLQKSADGAVDGRFGQPAQNVKGLPLSNVRVDGRAVSFELKATSGGGLFRGTVADGGSIAGEFITAEGGYNIPFDLKRTGDAQIAAAPRNASVTKELEGRWNGSIEVGGKSERLILTMMNNADGTATATILDRDGSNVELPVAVSHSGANLTVEVGAVGATYTAVLNDAKELVGTWTQGPISLPLTLTRGPK